MPLKGLYVFMGFWRSPGVYCGVHNGVFEAMLAIETDVEAHSNSCENVKDVLYSSVVQNQRLPFLFDILIWSNIWCVIFFTAFGHLRPQGCTITIFGFQKKLIWSSKQPYEFGFGRLKIMLMCLGVQNWYMRRLVTSRPWFLHSFGGQFNVARDVLWLLEGE